MLKSLINYRSILLLISKVFILVLFLDPSNKIFGLKNALFFIICSVWLLWILLKERYTIHFPKSFIFVPAFMLFIVVYSVIIVVFKDNYLNLYESLNYIKVFIFFLYLIILIDADIQIERTFMKYSIVIAIITVFVFIFYILIPDFFSKCYHYLVYQKSVAKFAFRTLFNINIIMLFYNTSPVLVFPLSYYIVKYKKSSLVLSPIKKIKYGLLFLLIFISLILSGTRANIFSAGLIIILYFVFEPASRLKLDKKHKYLLFGIIISFSFLFTITYILPEFLNPEEISNKVKFKHIYSYIDLFAENVSIFLFGHGLGAVFYSEGVNAYTTNTEFTYFDIIRFFGMPLAIIFFIILILPLIYFVYKYKYLNNKNYIYISYFFYLFIAGTNPLLLSSTGMIVVILVYSTLIFQLNDRANKYLILNEKFIDLSVTGR